MDSINAQKKVVNGEALLPQTYGDPRGYKYDGPPEDVAALVEKLGAASAALTLVNVNPVESRTVILQAGGYGEHQFDEVTSNGRATSVGGPLLAVRLEPGCGARLVFRMTRYRNQPTLAHPWDRG